MAHGGEDWGRYAPAKTIFTVQDLGELAARLKSIDTFDRRGNIIWLDDFESGLSKWGVDTVGAGTDLKPSAEFCRSGAFAAKGTLPGGVSASITMSHYEPFPVLSNFGFECHISLYRKVTAARLYLYLLYGATSYNFSVRYDVANKKLQYQDEDQALQDLATDLSLYNSNNCFHAFKLVVDSAKREYKRLIVDDTTYLLDTFKPWSNPTGAANLLAPAIAIANSGDDDGFTYVDDVILTQNEP